VVLHETAELTHVLAHPALDTAGEEQLLFLGIVDAVVEVTEELEKVVKDVQACLARLFHAPRLSLGGVEDFKDGLVLSLQDLPPAHRPSRWHPPRPWEPPAGPVCVHLTRRGGRGKRRSAVGVVTGGAGASGTGPVCPTTLG